MDQRFFQPLRIFALKLAELAYFWTIQPGIQFILPLKLGVEFYSKDALLSHGMQIDESIVQVCDNRAEAEELTPKLMAMDNPPDGYFAVNDDTAIGVLYTVKHAGFKVPEEVQICGFTNGQRAVACDPMLTTVEQRGHRVGEEAATILMDKVEGLSPLDKVEKHVVKTRLVVRGTTK